MKEMNLIDIIRDSLKEREPRVIENTESRHSHSSVLIPLFGENEQYHVLFTMRTNRVEHHKGQISFPGGAVDTEDGSFKETALREAHEEIGLLTKDVELLGQIDDEIAAVSNFVIHPFVGRIPYPYKFQINRLEVERLIFIPLKIFTDKDSGYKKEVSEEDGFPYRGIAYEYQGDVIWGATARIIENFVGIIEEKIVLA